MRNGLFLSTINDHYANYVLCSLTYDAQYYAQEHELLPDYYTIYIQFCMSNSLHVAGNFIKTVLLECINERYQIYHYTLLFNDCLIRVYQSFIKISTYD